MRWDWKTWVELPVLHIKRGKAEYEVPHIEILNEKAVAVIEEIIIRTSWLQKHEGITLTFIHDINEDEIAIIKDIVLAVSVRKKIGKDFDDMRLAQQVRTKKYISGSFDLEVIVSDPFWEYIQDTHLGMKSSKFDFAELMIHFADVMWAKIEAAGEDLTGEAEQ